MSTPSLKSFNDAFTSASKRDGKLTPHHEAQLDKLQELADAITAEGTFTATLTKWVDDSPALEIKHKDDKRGFLFRVGFGYEAFGGTPTIALSYTAARIPVGKPEGYALGYTSDNDALLKALGEAVAKRRNETKLSEAALKYATRNKAATP